MAHVLTHFLTHLKKKKRNYKKKKQDGIIMRSIIFFDLNNDFVEAYKTTIGEDKQSIYFMTTDVQDLVRDYNITVLVSPANCFGFMDGGIDMVYMAMFPGIQNKVQDRMKTFKITTPLGRHAIPIGSAMLVPTGNKQCPLLACVPTMFLPEKIIGTKNVYWAMRGLLTLIDSCFENKKVVVAVPSFGTGVGKMSAVESATQVKNALEDHEREGLTVKTKTSTQRNYAYVLNQMACPQPDTYANKEAADLTTEI